MSNLKPLPGSIAACVEAIESASVIAIFVRFISSPTAFQIANRLAQNPFPYQESQLEPLLKAFLRPGPPGQSPSGSAICGAYWGTKDRAVSRHLPGFSGCCRTEA